MDRDSSQRMKTQRQGSRSATGPRRPPASGLRVAAWTAAVLAVGVPVAGHAQDYPSRPVRSVVPFAAGGINDTLKQTSPGIYKTRIGMGGVNLDVVADTAKSPKTLEVIEASRGCHWNAVAP